MKPLDKPAWTAEHLEAVATLYRTTHHVRLRTRAQRVLLAAEQQLGGREMAAMVREGANPVRGWLKRSAAPGTLGLQEQWAGGAPSKVTPAYREQWLQLVRRRPRSLGLPYSTWTRQRLADELAEMVLSRPQHPSRSPDPE